MVDNLWGFIAESNRIEGIDRVTPQEIGAHERFLARDELTVQDFVDLVAVLQPDAVLRDRAGLNVYVGNHVPPAGGPGIPEALERMLANAKRSAYNAYVLHHAYETLHPFTDGNGRSGRALWLWLMKGSAPLGFLHQWYYQSLEHHRK